MTLKQITLAFREQMIAWMNIVGLEFENVRDQTNSALRGLLTWTVQPFLATNFSANGSMTWTVTASQLSTFEWSQVGKTLVVHLHIVGSSVAGTLNTQLRMLLPAGLSGSGLSSGVYSYRDNNTYAVGVWEVPANSTTCNFYRVDKTNWQASTNLTDIRATLLLSVL